jgi:hypothetical protein
MRIVYSFLVASVLLVAASAMAGTPEAIVEGPAERKAGQTITLDARKSKSDDPLEWRLLGEESASRKTPMRTFDGDGRRNVYVQVEDAEEGVYDFILVARGDVEKEKGVIRQVMAFKTHRVVVRPPAPPPAPPPPVPGPDEDMTPNVVEASFPAMLRKYRREIGKAYADQWDAAADALEKGATVKDALSKGVARGLQSRENAFSAILKPELNKVLPGGTEPADPSLRKRVVEQWHAIASTLREMKN